ARDAGLQSQGNAFWFHDKFLVDRNVVAVSESHPKKAEMSEPKQEIWLMRHGETEWSASGAHTSRTDLPLLPSGIKQAEELKTKLKGRKFALVLVSPMQRARETCRLAGYAGKAEISDDLKEWDYGL